MANREGKAGWRSTVPMPRNVCPMVSGAGVSFPVVAGRSRIASQDRPNSSTVRAAVTRKAPRQPKAAEKAASGAVDRKSVVEGKSVSVRVDIGGRRNIKTKKQPAGKTQRRI